VRVVKAYNTFDQEVARFDTTNTHLAATATKAQRVVGVFFPIISFAVNASLVLTLWMAREWVADGQMQVP
jgi:ATP-binding cassette subfamily B protein